jgi:hypothetical protein
MGSGAVPMVCGAHHAKRVSHTAKQARCAAEVRILAEL